MESLSNYPETSKITTIEKLMNTPKGNILKFGDTDEEFNKIIKLNTDAQQRNVIGHLECYEYDGVTQQVTYYPSCVVGKGEKKQLYLIEFLRNTVSLFETVFILNELVYQTKKSYYAFSGQTVVSPHVFDDCKKTAKVGRNEQCPCGSGKKYKKCCGY
jgi:hypothetical protein